MHLLYVNIFSFIYKFLLFSFMNSNYFYQRVILAQYTYKRSTIKIIIITIFIIYNDDDTCNHPALKYNNEKEKNKRQEDKSPKLYAL